MVTDVELLQSSVTLLLQLQTQGKVLTEDQVMYRDSVLEYLTLIVRQGNDSLKEALDGSD